MSGEDIEALLGSLTTLRDLAIVLLMLDGDFRPGEVLCPQLADISYGRRRVTIRKRDDHPRGPAQRHATSGSWTCTNRASWTRSTVMCCTNAPLDADKQPVRVLGRRNRATSVRAFELPGGGAWLRPPPGTARDPHPGLRRIT